MSLRLLLLSRDGAQASQCLHVGDDGHVLERTWRAPGDAATPFAPEASRTVLVVPGTEARALRLEIVAHTHAQALAAARGMVDDRLARQEGPLHVAVGAGDGDGSRLVVVVAEDTMQGWLARAAALGLPADTATPDYLLLPAPSEDAVGIVDYDGRWIVRGGALAFSAEPALADQVIAGRPRRVIDAADHDKLFANAALAPEVDLLQGGFAPTPGRRPGLRDLRSSLWLALAVMLSPLLVTAVQALRYELAARQLHAAAGEIAGGLFPDVSTTSPATIRDRLQAMREPESFHSAVHALFAAVGGTPGTHLHSLDYRGGIALRATLVHASREQLDAIHAALASAGWRLTEGNSVPADTGMRTELVLEPAP